MALMTQLEAVNIALKTIGEAPVNTLSGTLPVDVSTAVSTLDEVRRKINEKGWNYNTEDDVETSLDGNSEVVLAANVVKCKMTYPNSGVNAVQRGTRLYDKKNHTYVFAEAPHLDITYHLDWDELPEAARSYIAYRAARIFQARHMGAPELDQYATREELDALAALKASNTQTSRPNIFQSPEMSRFYRYRRP